MNSVKDPARQRPSAPHLHQLAPLPRPRIVAPARPSRSIVSVTQACSTSTPGQDLYPAAGPAAFESPRPEVATRPIASIDNGCQPSAGRVPDKGGARWSACPGSLPSPPVLSEELVPG